MHLRGFERTESLAEQAAPTPVGRRPPWRSPGDQPGWARPALLVVAALAAICYGWGIETSPMHSYYGAAVRSMSMSWRAFWSGGFDPAASITIDKIPGSFWLQALSVRAFGYHDWAVALPQTIEAVLTVLVLYKVIRRWSGPSAGLIGALVMACTPIAAALARSEIVDTLLTLLLVLAASAWQQAVRSGRLRALLLSGTWVGLAFQVKMLQAWAVLPAFAIVYLVAAPGSLARRAARLAAMGALTLAVSSVWTVVMLLTPAADRPYIDATTDNNPIGMVIGYNALSRFDPGAATKAVGSLGNSQASGAPTWTAMFSDRMAPQIGWLFPLCVLAVVFGLVWRRHEPRTDIVRAGFLMWGLWLVTHAVAFSIGQVNHSYYTVVMGPAVAALAGGGLVMFWRAYREPGRRAWVLPLALGCTVVWSVSVSLRFPKFLQWVAPVAAVLALVGICVLYLAKSTGRTRSRLATLGVLTGILAVVFTPAAWSVSTDLPGQSCSKTVPSAGPCRHHQQSPPGMLSARDVALLSFLRAHTANAKYLVAVAGSLTAGRYIIGAGVSILPMGGLTDHTPYPSTAEFTELIKTGQLRYVLIDTRQHLKGTDTARDIAWTVRHCTLVSPAFYGGLSDRKSRQRLYDCEGKA